MKTSLPIQFRDKLNLKEPYLLLKYQTLTSYPNQEIYVLMTSKAQNCSLSCN
ncbi:hypothetical protein JHK87_034347 [Glycine soja]|uniref:Uncharacterized protein n=1 Tax=Glycine max TaxID=3847 RepID=K7LVX4_SOYBN|nr:hypothetical protein JHK87_034347 [Glycine soja]